MSMSKSICDNVHVPVCVRVCGEKGGGGERESSNIKKQNDKWKTSCFGLSTSYPFFFISKNQHHTLIMGKKSINF
jgi:hypothetical protein